MTVTSMLPARVARRLVNLVVGDTVRVVRVRSGVASGCHVALDLSKEKAYWLGHYEREVQEFLRAHVRPGDVVYDVGAHVGFFCVCAARRGADVFAFEPDPGNAARLRTNAGLNGFPIEVVEAAVWRETGTVELLPGDSAKEFHVVAGAGAASVALDDFAARERPPTLVKLDVEGAEVEALRGARRMLAEAQPLVVCELHGERERREVLELPGGFRVEELGGPLRIVARPEERAT